MKGQLPCLQAGSTPTIQTSDCLGDTKWCRRRRSARMERATDLLGYTVEELRALVQEGIDSGPGSRATMPI
jgi:hypothetical protein